MTTPPSHEWAGLEPFVQQLRDLEAPPVADIASRRDDDARAHVGTPHPVVSVAPRQVPWRVGMLAAAVAALAVIRQAGPAIGARGESRTPRDSASAPTSATASKPDSDPQAAMVAFLSPWPAVAIAQRAPGAAPLTPYPPLTTVDPTRLKPGHRTYVRLSANDYHASLPHEVWTNDLDTVRYRGLPAWRLVRRVERMDVRGQPNNIMDTLWMRRADLRPIARRVNSGTVLASSFTYSDTLVTELDSVIMPKALADAMRAAGQKPAVQAWSHHHTLTIGSPWIVNSEYLRLLLRAAPLSATWRASVQVERQPYDRPKNEAGFVNLRVAGIDTVQHFNGRFPAWRVAVEGGARPETWYVSQQTGETLVTDGPLSVNYPESRSMLVYGLEETVRVAPVRRR